MIPDHDDLSQLEAFRVPLHEDDGLAIHSFLISESCDVMHQLPLRIRYRYREEKTVEIPASSRALMTLT